LETTSPGHLQGLRVIIRGPTTARSHVDAELAAEFGVESFWWPLACRSERAGDFFSREERFVKLSPHPPPRRRRQLLLPGRRCRGEVPHRGNFSLAHPGLLHDVAGIEAPSEVNVQKRRPGSARSILVCGKGLSKGELPADRGAVGIAQMRELVGYSQDGVLAGAPSRCRPMPNEYCDSSKLRGPTAFPLSTRSAVFLEFQLFAKEGSAGPCDFPRNRPRAGKGRVT